MWLGVAGCGWVWLGVAGCVYLSSLPCNKEREVGEEKGLGGRGKRVGWERKKGWVGEEKGLGGRFSHLPPPPS